MKKIFLVIFLIQFLTSGCSASPRNMEAIRELTQNPKARKWNGNEGDVNDLRGCQFLYEQKWTYSERWHSWGPDQHWFDGRMITGTGVTLDFKDDLSQKILQNLNLHPIYLGPWHPTTLSQTTGFFPFSSTKTETKLIRFFAYANKSGGNIQYQYESQTEKNKNIPEKKFSLPPNAKIAPDRFGLCVVKWTAKYGYNAIAEVKSKNHFSKDYLVPTGRVINSETGEIIVDETLTNTLIKE